MNQLKYEISVVNILIRASFIADHQDSGFNYKQFSLVFQTIF